MLQNSAVTSTTNNHLSFSSSELFMIQNQPWLSSLRKNGHLITSFSATTPKPLASTVFSQSVFSVDNGLESFLSEHSINLLANNNNTILKNGYSENLELPGKSPMHSDGRSVVDNEETFVTTCTSAAIVNDEFDDDGGVLSDPDSIVDGVSLIDNEEMAMMGDNDLDSQTSVQTFVQKLIEFQKRQVGSFGQSVEQKLQYLQASSSSSSLDGDESVSSSSLNQSSSSSRLSNRSSFNKPPVNNRNYQEARYKTELCLHYRERNQCPHGLRCLFAHGLEELRPYRGRHPKHKTQRCKAFHEQGFCNYGYRCSYIHSESPRTINYIKRLNHRAQIVRRNRLTQQFRKNRSGSKNLICRLFDWSVSSTTSN